MDCEGADRQADFPCAAWHGREPIQKGFLLKNKRGWGMSRLIQTQAGWEAPSEEGKCLYAGTRLPCEEQMVAMIQGSSRGGMSPAAVMLPVPGCCHQPAHFSSLPKGGVGWGLWRLWL